MMTLPIKVSDTEMDLWILLEDENIERLKKYDPAEVVKKHLVGRDKMLQGLDYRNVMVAYMSPADLATMMPMLENGDLIPALKHLSRGFAYKPESGDHDDDYKSVLRRQ